MSKKSKNTEKIVYVAPIAVVASIAVAIIGGNEGNVLLDMVVIIIAATGLCSGIVALTRRLSAVRNIIMIISVILNLYLGIVAVFRIGLSGMGFLG